MRNQKNKLRRDQFFNFVSSNIGKTLQPSQKKIFKEYLFKIAGIFYGCALGEIIGKQGNNKTHKRMLNDFPDEIIPFPTEYRRKMPPGRWTENTAQLILIMDMLAENEENEYGSNWETDLNNFAKKLKRWNKNGFRKLGDDCGLGIDDITSRVINKPHFISNPKIMAIEAYRELGSNRAPNGCLIRGVLTAVLRDHEKAALDMASCTHADPRCLAATTVIDSIISFLLRCNVNELSIEWMTDSNIAKYILEPSRKYVKNSKRNNLISEYDKYSKIALMPLVVESEKQNKTEKDQNDDTDQDNSDQNDNTDQDTDQDTSDQEGDFSDNDTKQETEETPSEELENSKSSNKKRKKKGKKKSVKFKKTKKKPHLGFLPMGGLEDDESDSIESLSDPNNDVDLPEESGTLLGCLKLDNEQDMQSKDYCLKTMVCAVWAFRKVRDFLDDLMYEIAEVGMNQIEAHEKINKFFKETISEIVKRGGDSKTNAALVGAILGCAFLYIDLPDDWVLKILDKDWSDQKLKNLFWSL